MTESKEVYGLTLYKCPYIKNTWLTEGSCIQQQNKVRKELLENYPRLKYIQKCINCKDGLERAERLGIKLIGVEHLFKEKKMVKREPNYKKSVCSIPNLNPNSLTLKVEGLAKKLGYSSLADCIEKLNGVKSQSELGSILGVNKSTIGYWQQKLQLEQVKKTCSIPGITPTKRTLEIEEVAKGLGYESLADCLNKEVGNMSHNQIGRMLNIHPGSISKWMQRLKNAR